MKQVVFRIPISGRQTGKKMPKYSCINHTACVTREKPLTGLVGVPRRKGSRSLGEGDEIVPSCVIGVVVNIGTGPWHGSARGKWEWCGKLENWENGGGKLRGIK